MVSFRREERVARVRQALYARIMRFLHTAMSRNSRQVVETALFIVLLHAVALLVLLHVSFISASQSPSCLAPYLPPALTAQSPKDVHLVRIQIVGPSACASNASSSCLHPPVLASFVFASQRELLALRHSPALLHHRTNGGLPLVTVPRTSACFDLRWIGQSSPLWDLVLDHTLGYDTIVGNHVLRWRRDGGVVLNEVSGQVHDMGSLTPPPTERSVLAKGHTFYLCISLFFTCVTCAMFLGQELIALWLVFRDLLHQQNGSDGLTQARCAQSFMVVPIVLGIIFFFLELYGHDGNLAVGVLAVVGVSDSFASICARSPLSRRFFPGFLFCWFALFHMYLIAYPTGFSHAALGVLAMTVLHTMVFFLNCIELPHFLLAHGRHATSIY